MDFDRAESQILATLFALELRPEEWWQGRPGRRTRQVIREHIVRFWPSEYRGAEDRGAEYQGTGVQGTEVQGTEAQGTEDQSTKDQRTEDQDAQGAETWDGAFERLKARDLLSERGGELSLSEKGQKAGADLRAIFRRQRFDEVLVQSEQSSTYRAFCRRTSGLDLRAFSPINGAQLGAVLEALGLSPTDRLLDAGCGTGHVAEEIVRRAGATALGVDQAAKAIQLAAERTAEDPRLSFQVLDLAESFDRESLGDASGGASRGASRGGAFQSLLAVDALAFLDDLEAAIGRLAALLEPGGRLVALTMEGAESPGEAPTAKALRALGLDFEQRDFTDQARSLMRARSFAASALRGAFRREGFELLGLALTQEAERLSPLVESGRLRRYLYRALI